jgi:hypothetical protein
LLLFASFILPSFVYLAVSQRAALTSSTTVFDHNVKLIALLAFRISHCYSLFDELWREGLMSRQGGDFNLPMPLEQDSLSRIGKEHCVIMAIAE